MLASMDDHQCLMPGCEKLVDARWPLCRDHHDLLPDKIRMPLVRAYSPGYTLADAPPGLYRAIAEALAWIQKTFGGKADERDPGAWDRLCRYVRDRDEARAQAAGREYKPIEWRPGGSAPAPRSPPQLRLV